MKVTILGAGTWGLALAEVLVYNKCNVSVWHYRKNYVAHINKVRFHNALDSQISSQINFISDPKKIDEASIILICLPSQAIRSVLSSLQLKNQYYIIASKGIETKSGKLISEVIMETSSFNRDNIIACISGPSHAEELIQRIPTVMAVASNDLGFSRNIQETFSNNFLRIYQADSIEAVLVGGAVKNVISIASGICVGLGYGDNTIAALITRGIQEIIRFSSIYTDKSNSLLGVSGIGDLIVTATSTHSRNKSFGILIGSGKSLPEALNETGMIVEGVDTAKSVYAKALKHNISMPICDEVYNVLFKDKDPKAAINELMIRKLTSE